MRLIYSKEDRERFLKEFKERKIKLKYLCDEKGIKYSTAYSWLKFGPNGRKRNASSLKKKVKTTNEQEKTFLKVTPLLKSDNSEKEIIVQLSDKVYTKVKLSDLKDLVTALNV